MSERRIARDSSHLVGEEIRSGVLSCSPRSNSYLDGVDFFKGPKYSIFQHATNLQQ